MPSIEFDTLQLLVNHEWFEANKENHDVVVRSD
jgi:hypothetical protein